MPRRVDAPSGRRHPAGSEATWGDFILSSYTENSNEPDLRRRAKDDGREPILAGSARSSDGVEEPERASAPRPSPSLSASMRRHPHMVFLPVIVLLTLALLVGIARTPTYTATARLAVGGLGATGPSELTGFADAAQQLAQTYSRSVQGDAVVRSIAERTGSSPDQVRSNLAAAPIPETPVFKIEATSEDSEGAVRLANLTSDAMVTQVERSEQHPEELLEEYRAAELERERLSKQVELLSVSPGEEQALARSELVAAEARAESLRTAYTLRVQTGTVPLQVIQRADQASSDRSSRLQLLAFVAIVAGLIIGMALAVFRDTATYERVKSAFASYRKAPSRTATAGTSRPLQNSPPPKAKVDNTSNAKRRRRRRRAGGSRSSGRGRT
jgi:capsular polysaccharide biosynthesis protein